MDGRHKLTADENEEDNQSIDTPSLEGLRSAKLLLLDNHLVSWILVLDEKLIVDKHCDDSSYRTKDSRRLRSNKMGTAELNDDREHAHEEGDGEILQDLRTVCHHQDEEWSDEEHQRELQDDEGGYLTQILGRSHTTGCYLIGKCRSRQTNGAETYGHCIGYQTDNS